MKKLGLIACAVAGFVGSSFADDYTQWNPFMQRWEYHYDDGTTGYSQYNQFMQRWEYNHDGQTGYWQWNQFMQRWEWKNN